eukprot:gene85-3478_t
MSNDGHKVVSKEERLACWSARDEYYHCCAIKGREECGSFKDAFFKKCPAAWVQHFERRRLYEQYRQKLLTQGYKLKEADQTTKS